MTMKKVIWILGIVTAMLIIGASWYIISDLLEIAERENEEIIKVESKTEELAEEKQADSEEAQVYLNPFEESIEIDDLTDNSYQDYIHKMAHQKVIANTKWGFHEITDERINWLIEGLTVLTLEHADVYQDILTRWAAGDFSRVDKDHNIIWKLQGGTIGEATGILSAEEEKSYIEDQN